MEEFRLIVSKYVQLSDNINELNKQLKTSRDDREKLSEFIIQFMVQQNIDNCSLPTGDTLLLKKQVQFGSLNKEYIEETLNSLFKTPLPKEADKLAEITAEAIMKNREVKEKPQLKIQKKK